MSSFKASSADREFITVLLEDPEKKRPPLRLENFEEYAFSAHFLHPTDAWHFSFGAENLPKDVAGLIVPGAKVELFVDGALQSTGFVDSVSISTSRSGGVEYKIEGRDKLAKAVDACANPVNKLKDGQTLAEALVDIFKNYGWSKESDFSIDPAADRDVKSNKFRGKTRPSEAKGFGRRALRDYKMHQDRPKSGESVYQFASRITERFGLWLWPSADGKTLYVHVPDFEQAPRGKLLNNRDGTTNVLSGSVKYSSMNQPSAIIADGVSGKADFGSSKIIVIMFNNMVTLGDKPQDPEVLKYEKAGAKFIEGPVFPFPSLIKLNDYSPQYIHDEQSTNLEQLEAFVRRTMSLCQRQALEVSYTVEGHGQEVDGHFMPWTIDTIVSVEDKPSGLKEDLYILGRTFQKSRGGGTTTQLELILKNTLVFTATDSKKR